MGANPTPQLQAALAPNSLPNVPTQPVPGATSIGQWPGAGATVQPPAFGGTPGSGSDDGLTPGELALLLMACIFLAGLAGIFVWLKDGSFLGAILGAGGAFLLIVPVAFMIVRSVHRRRR